MWNPWGRLAELTHVRLRFSHHLPHGILGTYNHDTAEITLRPGMSQAQRRSTLAHELVHHDRGRVPASHTTREETAVCREAARRLITFPDLANALVWAYDQHELAELLWVDVPTVIARLDGLTPGETRELSRLLDEAELRMP